MAKKSKKSHSSNKSSKKKDNTLLWGVIALVIIVVVILLVRGGCETETGEGQQPTTAPEEQQETDQEQETTQLDLKEAKCDESAAIGYKSCSMVEDGNVKFTILHQGGGTLLGFQYYIYDDNGEKVGEDAEMQAVEGGAQATLTLPTNKFQNVDRVEIRPIMTVNGEDSVCKNQAVIQHTDRC